MFKGITDLGGIGKVVGECRKFVMDLLRYHAECRNRALKDAEQVQKNQALRLKNQLSEIKNKDAALQLIQRVFRTAKKCGRSPEEVQDLLKLLTATEQSGAQEIPTLESDAKVLPETTPKLLSE